MNKKITLKQIQLKDTINDTLFLQAYKKLVTDQSIHLSDKEIFLLLKFAIIFINNGEVETQKFGYRIILLYSNSFNDYKPLYDISLEKNYIPVAKFIEQKYFKEENESNFNNLMIASYIENFKHIRNEKTIYFSLGQKRLNQFSKNSDDYVIVAPTSYGKSELIITKTEENPNKNICIIVPTKSLLAQTKKNLISNKIIRESNKKIITHPDMLKSIEQKIIAVLTQERLLRILQKHPDLFFDIILIDEAHNLLENNIREILIIQDLKILKKRNPKSHFYYFTPFLANPKNLKVFSNDDTMKTDKIDEYIKVEKYYTFDLNSQEKFLKIYDQFLNIFFKIKSHKKITNEFDFINLYAAKKNIVYINRPKHIENFAINVDFQLSQNAEILKVQNSLKLFLHKSYNLIKTIGNGIVYHHGGMPENVRLYVEDAFSKIDDIKYIITSSTLLQGVNIPAEKIFLLNTMKGQSSLNAAQFKNLSGRVCRFSEVFNLKTGNLNMLEPEIYLIKGKYTSNRANLENFLSTRVKDNKIIVDAVDNPLIKKNLQELTTDEEKEYLEHEEYLENIEPETTNNDNIRIVKTDIGKVCFKNNIHDFDIFVNEPTLNENLNNNYLADISNTKDLLKCIVNIFISNVKFKYKECSKYYKKNGEPYKKNGVLHEKSSGTYCGRIEGHYLDKNCNFCTTQNLNFRRLINENTQAYYSMYLKWRASATSYKQMISVITKYWNELPNDRKIVFIGSTWGEVALSNGGWQKRYVDLKTKTELEVVNLAIVRIKEEQDFVDYNLMPYIEVLNDLTLIDPIFYDQIKYGTSNPKLISMLKEGFSLELAKIVNEKQYQNNIYFKDYQTSIRMTDLATTNLAGWK